MDYKEIRRQVDKVLKDKHKIEEELTKKLDKRQREFEDKQKREGL